MKKNFSTSLLVSLSFIALAAVIYLVGISITGAISESMYCEEGVCKKLCNFDTDCSSSNICCTKGDFGVCDSLESCEAFVSALEDNYVGETVEIGGAREESPADLNMKYLVPVYIILVALLLLFTLYYFLKGKKKVVKSKVVRKRVVKKKK